MKVQIKGTYGKNVDFSVFDKLPQVGDEWICKGYEDAHIFYIRCVNDQIAETTAGNPTYDYDFYDIHIEMDDDTFIEHICIRKDEEEGGEGYES